MTGIDIRVKILISTIFSILALVYRKPQILFILLIINIVVLFLLKVPIKLDGMKNIFYTSIALIVVQSFFIQDGDCILMIKDICILTSDGLYYGMEIITRFFILLLSGLILYHANDNELILGLVKLKVPYEIVFMIQLAIRFLPAFIEEMQDTIYAIQLRGVDLKKVYKKEILKLYVQIFTPIVYSAWSKAEKLSVLIELRGFKKNSFRTYYREIYFKRKDYIIMYISLMMTAIFVYTANKW